MANPFGGTNNPATNPKMAAEKLKNMARRGRFRQSYTVQRGDSWFDIAGRLFNGFMGWDDKQAQLMAFELAKANPDIGLLQPGMEIRVPVPRFNPRIPVGWPSPGFGQPPGGPDGAAAAASATTAPGQTSATSFPATANPYQGSTMPYIPPQGTATPALPLDYYERHRPAQPTPGPYQGSTMPYIPGQGVTSQKLWETSRSPSLGAPSGAPTAVPAGAGYGGGPPSRTPRVTQPAPTDWAQTQQQYPAGIPAVPGTGATAGFNSFYDANPQVAQAMQQAKFDKMAQTGEMPAFLNQLDIRLLSETLAQNGINIPWWDTGAMSAFLTANGYVLTDGNFWMSETPPNNGLLGGSVQTAPLGGPKYSFGGGGRGGRRGGGGGRGGASGYGNAGGQAREMGPVTWRIG